MKRTISVILVALLLTLAAFALAACNGGVSTEEEWNAAVDYLSTCKAITLEINEKKVQGTGLDKSTDKTTTKISYDATNGILNFYKETSPYSAFGARRYTSHDDQYFVIDGSDVKEYAYHWRDNDEKEQKTGVTHYDNAEASALALREKYLEYLNTIAITNLAFNDFSPSVFGGYEAIGSGGFVIKVSFSNGKFTKYHFEQKPIGSPNSVEQDVSIKYSAKITLPK